MATTNRYGPSTLIANWSEDRFAEGYADKFSLRQYEMPTRTAGQWKKSSDKYGEGVVQQEGYVAKDVYANRANYLKYYNIPSAEFYETTCERALADPSTKEYKDEATQNSYTLDQEFLANYRETWTKADPGQFYRKADEA